MKSSISRSAAWLFTAYAEENPDEVVASIRRYCSRVRPRRCCGDVA
jgi:hypothetical protein